MRSFLLICVGVLSIAGITGYATAMNRHKANQALDMATRLAIAAQTYGSAGLTDGESKTADELGISIPEDLYVMAQRVYVTNNNGIFEVHLGITDSSLLEGIKVLSGSSSGSVIRFDERGIVTD